jgi:prepilin peptidase CpaA
MTAEALVPVIAAAIGLAACVTDLRSRRIPNALTLGAAAVGIMFHLVTGGWHGTLTSAGGWFLGAVLFFPFFALGGMGGGDVKLLAALGAWLGPGETLWVAIYSGIAGGVLAVIVALSKGYLRTAVSNVFGAFAFWGMAGLRPVPGLTLESKEAPRLAFAIPILVGTMVTLWQR